jgi:hypothetical protein
MNPYPLLVWLEENGGGVTGGTDAAYCKAPQGPTPDLPGARPDLDPGNAYDARPSPIIVGERDDHRFPEPENASESGTDEKERPGTFGGWIGATDAGTNAGSADSSAKEDMAKDSHGGSSTPVESGRARSGDQASRSSAEDDPPGSSPQKKARSLPPERLSSWPDRTMWRYHASILAHALRRAEIRKPEITKDRNDEKNASKKEGDGRDAGIPEKKKQKEEVKEFANPLEESKEPEENRSVSETDTAQQRPAPREKDTTNARSFGENPKASPTKQPRHRSRSASSSANPKEGKTASSTEDAR